MVLLVLRNGWLTREICHCSLAYTKYSQIAFAAVELAIALHAFWAANGSAFRESHPRTSNAAGSRLKEAIFTMPSARTTWICALFLLGYVGVEVALGGWIVEFMIRVRDAEAFASGMSETGFWLGITVGRVVLGFVTPRIGEKLAIMVCSLSDHIGCGLMLTMQIYLPCAMGESLRIIAYPCLSSSAHRSAGLQLVFWLVPQFYVSVVAVALQGFFLGPLFPAAVVVCTKTLPKHLHVSSIGFAAAFGG